MTTEVRSAHKAATRAALARIAAELDIAGQLHLKTLARTAGVSLRTFHNYFDGLHAAIDHYMKCSVADFVEKLQAGMPLSQAVAATDDVVQLHFVARGLLGTQSRLPVVDFLRYQRGFSALQAQLTTAAAGAVIQVVLENGDEQPSAELIHSAFSTNLKGIGDDCAIRKSP